MKKKLLTLLFVCVIGATAVACGTSKGEKSNDETVVDNEPKSEDSLVTIKGVFYGDCGEAQDGFSDLYVVFDYENDDTNRTMPESSSDVTINISESNTYNASDNVENKVYNRSGEYIESTYGWIERYTGYGYVLGYGNILGGAEPVRMFAHFDFNENDMNNGENFTLTVDDYTATYPVSDAQKISYVDEIMKVEDDFDTAQILAAEKWRLDSSYRVLAFISRNSQYGYGDNFSGLSQAMKTLFSKDSGGLSIDEEPESGFKIDTHTFNTVINDLPSYDHDIIISGYPEAASYIEELESQWGQIADAIVNPETSREQTAEMLNACENQYKQICDALGIEYGPK